MPTIRVQKVADLIRDEIARWITASADIHGALLTVTFVSLTPDMRVARVHVSIYPEGAPRAEILDGLARAAGRMRREVGRAVRLRRVPELEFQLDTTAEKVERIERLIREGRTPDGGSGPPGEREDEK
ncbi:MAG: 30S ribosome-binding factor RbfA [Acidobacteria bacterium]|nr:30S ribosome-binding factor RbfA [Acidobacteriota bacterium]